MSKDLLLTDFIFIAMFPLSICDIETNSIITLTMQSKIIPIEILGLLNLKCSKLKFLTVRIIRSGEYPLTNKTIAVSSFGFIYIFQVACINPTAGTICGKNQDQYSCWSVIPSPPNVSTASMTIRVAEPMLQSFASFCFASFLNIVPIIFSLCLLIFYPVFSLQYFLVSTSLHWNDKPIFSCKNLKWIIFA